jgi:hypothetical protein
VPGSFLIVTAARADSGGLPESVWPGGPTPADVASFFAGLDLLPPGLHEGAIVGGTGVKPAAGARIGTR